MQLALPLIGTVTGTPGLPFPTDGSEVVSDSANYDVAAEYIVEAGVLDAAAAAKKSLMNLGDAISYVDGARMQAILEAFYNAIDYSVIGGNVPDESFYYKK